MRKIGIFLILFSLLLPFSLVSANQCEDCYGTHARRCKKLCVNAGFGRSRCEEKCKKTSCDQVCSLPEQAPQQQYYNPYKGLNSCESCRARARDKQCGKQCLGLMNSEERGYCLSNCANQACQKSCDRAQKATERKKPGPKITCFACRKRKITECGPQCGDPNEPGFVSCRRACAEKACLKICRPDLF